MAKSSTAVDDVNAVYQDAIEQLQETIGSVDASAAQKKAARDALNDLFLLHGAHSIQEIDGRTALLSGLIIELQGVIDKIQARPFGDALSQITKIADTARDLYEESKKEIKNA